MCDRGYEARPLVVRDCTIQLWVGIRNPASADRIGVVQRTLALLPSAHLGAIAIGHIRLSQPGDWPPNGGGANDAPRRIRLSAVSLAAAQDYSPTLLHEMGHVVDYQFKAMEVLKHTHRRLWDILRNTPHAGITHTDGDRFGDCYMIYFLTQVAGAHHATRAASAEYRGAERDTRFSALLSSTAFYGWTGPLSHLRVPPETR